MGLLNKIFGKKKETKSSEIGDSALPEMNYDTFVISATKALNDPIALMSLNIAVRVRCLYCHTHVIAQDALVAGGYKSFVCPKCGKPWIWRAFE